jgi:arsenate reductase
MSAKIYHNPRCSKSRATLALLEDRGIDTEVILYLESPPDESELNDILALLDKSPRELMRKGQSEYGENGLGDDSLSHADLVRAMVMWPILIERPIVISKGKAAIGRPPESVLDIL